MKKLAITAAALAAGCGSSAHIVGNKAPDGAGAAGSVASQHASWTAECKTVKAVFDRMNSAPASVSDGQLYEEASRGLIAAATPGNVSINPQVLTLAADFHVLGRVYSAGRQPSLSQNRTLITDGSIVTGNCPMINFSGFGH
jgi:hypothetical protein